MIPASREERINHAFVAVAGTLIDNYDVVDLLMALVNECTELLDITAGGLLIANGIGTLELIAASSEEAEFVEVMQLAAGAGPCVDCYTSGTQVSVADIGQSGGQWPDFSAAALKKGFRSIHSTPLRIRGTVIGALNLLGTSTGALTPRDASLAQALADVAVIGILQERSLNDLDVVNEQLYLALDTRILVEQAKGVIAQEGGVTMGSAFTALRAYSRAHSVDLRTVAAGVIDRTVLTEEIAAPDASTTTG